MDESLKSLRWSILVMNAGCISIIAGILSIEDAGKTVTVMSFTVPLSIFLILGYTVVLVLQGQMHLHLKHVDRLHNAGVDNADLSRSPVIAMHAGHDEASLDRFLSYSLLTLQLFLLPIFAGVMTSLVSASFVFLRLIDSWGGRVLHLFPLAMLAVISLSAWRTYRLFRTLAKQIDVVPDATIDRDCP